MIPSHLSIYQMLFNVESVVQWLWFNCGSPVQLYGGVRRVVQRRGSKWWFKCWTLWFNVVVQSVVQRCGSKVGHNTVGVV